MKLKDEINYALLKSFWGLYHKVSHRINLGKRKYLEIQKKYLSQSLTLHLHFLKTEFNKKKL